MRFLQKKHSLGFCKVFITKICIAADLCWKNKSSVECSKVCKDLNFNGSEMITLNKPFWLKQQKLKFYCQCWSCSSLKRNRSNCENYCFPNTSISLYEHGEGCSKCTTSDKHRSQCVCKEVNCDDKCGGKGLGFFENVGGCKVCSGCENMTTMLSGWNRKPFHFNHLSL